MQELITTFTIFSFIKNINFIIAIKRHEYFKK